jgi:hypothetical protein
MKNAWNSPMAAPAASPAKIARVGSHPFLTDSTAVIDAHTPLTEPTERSISPRSSTSVMPMEIVPTAAICSSRFVRLRDSRKNSDRFAKMIQMIARTRITRTDPSSPCASALSGFLKPCSASAAAAAARSASSSVERSGSERVSLIAPPPGCRSRR